MTSVYDLGWSAAKSGRIIKNPYSFGSENWDYWQEGFNDGISTWAQDKPIKQPIKEFVFHTFISYWIDPDGNRFEVYDHDRWALRHLLTTVGYNIKDSYLSPVTTLLKMGWIREINNRFEVYRLTRKEKDTIFKIAKDHGYDKIWVDESERPVIKDEPPEDLYESVQLSLFETIIGEQFSPGELRKQSDMADQVIQFQNTLKKQYPQIDKLYLWLRPSNMDIVVSAIKIKEEFRKQGIGSQIMKAINEFADQYGLSVSLDPDPQPGYKKKLIDFYKSHGFVRNKGRNTDFRISEPMYRKPQKSLKEMILGEAKIPPLRGQEFYNYVNKMFEISDIEENYGRIEDLIKEPDYQTYDFVIRKDDVDIINQKFKKVGWYIGRRMNFFVADSKIRPVVKIIIHPNYTEKSKWEPWHEKANIFEPNTIPQYLYHFTSIGNVDRIKRKGLIPKASSLSQFSYPDRIYFFTDMPDKDTVLQMAKDMKHGDVSNLADIALVKIDTRKAYDSSKKYDEHGIVVRGGNGRIVRYYKDPNVLFGSVFTYSHIKPEAIVSIKQFDNGSWIEI